MQADEIIEELGLLRHPEGGHYRQTFVDDVPGKRAFSTAIYYLLKVDEQSRWHRVDATEIWHWYGGAPLQLCQAISANDGGGLAPFQSKQVLGNNVLEGEFPQIVVPAGVWQSARSTGDWTLCGCTVAPGFEFDGFEMAQEGWEP